MVRMIALLMLMGASKMKLKLSMVLVVLIAVVSLWSDMGLAQAQGKVSGGSYIMQLLVGSFASAGGSAAAKLLPWRGAEAVGGILGAAIGIGGMGAVLNVRTNWLFGTLAAGAGWFLTDFFAADFFGPNGFTFSGPVSFRISAQDFLFWSRAVGTAFFSVLGFYVQF